ncbi:serine hydrolase [Kribbella sp. ALI-6-A]|uniref:serine hydrolase n=1 Tax=Kribbella sp. ALI-6-A TaxID=1933817 RepID=UPI00097BB4C7|nr:serine hydrolase [Kribbella sp. ALI-6-A]ONI74144.1 serine hydrolase [Kribbella sp. ALI-6-A]
MTTEHLLQTLRQDLADGGLRAGILVRDLHTGDELGIDPDVQLPSASLVKIPLALATLERIRRGDLDGSTTVEVQPGRITAPGPTGLSRFRHPSWIAIEDLVYLSTCLSDGTAADALFALTPPAYVAGLLREWNLDGISIRHTMHPLTDTPADHLPEPGLAQALAIDAGSNGRVPQLDTTRASSGSARAHVDLLQAIWTPSRIHPDVAAAVRTLMAHNVHRQRLTPDFSSDATTWSSKTGTLLNLRHEIGVAEHPDGQRYAIAALTASQVPAAVQPAAEALMSTTARALHDHLRQH